MMCLRSADTLPPHALPSLPFDILAILLQVLEAKADVNALMLTSRDVYTEGARRLLQFPITITDDERLVSFCRFILRDTSRRALSLRQLHVCIPLKLRHYTEGYQVYANDPELRGASLLVRVLKKATRLEDLSIDWCEEFLEREDRLVSSIASLSSLRSLRVSSFGLLSSELLHTMRSHLRTLEVDCWMEDIKANHYDDLPLPYLLHTLPAHLCQTLESLLVWYANVGRRHASQEGCETLRFPCLHTLSLRNPADVNLEFLTRTFPHLVRLDIMDVSFDIDSIEAIRSENLEQAGWPNLDEVSGDAESLYALGLPSSVRRVDAICPNDSFTTRRMLYQVLERTQPTHFLLHFGYCRHEDEEGWDPQGGVTDILDSDTLAQKVTHLALDISLNMQTDTHSPDLLDILLDSDVLPAYDHLAFLVLRLDTSLPQAETSSPGDAPWSEAYDPDRVFRDGSCFTSFVDPEECARDLAKEIPTMTYISLQIKGSPPAFWRVHGTGYHLRLETVDPIEGQKLLESEGLGFCLRTPEPRRLNYHPDDG